MHFRFSTTIAAVVTVCLSAGLAFSQSDAQDRSFLLKGRQEKGYGKRDRVFPNFSKTIAPSQLHEIYGVRAEAGVDYTQTYSKLRGNLRLDPRNNETVTTNAPGFQASAYAGGDIFVFGVGGAYYESNQRAKEFDSSEKLQNTKVLPQAALSLNDYVTLGLSSDVNWAKASAKRNDVEGINSFYYHRETASLSYHDPRFEAGFAYTPRVADTGRFDTKGNASGATSFTLAGRGEREEGGADRAIYAPAVGTLYVRGNLTDNFSMLASASHAQYDANRAESSKGIFDNYRANDRYAGKLQASWWFNDQASSISATGQYLGAAVAPVGLDENAFGYRFANLYGGSVDGVAEVGNRTYVGLMVGHLRGERDQTTDGFRFAGKEEKTRIGTTFATNF